MRIIQRIQTRIYELRNERVMLDFDLADLYGTPTKAFNQAVKRNPLRFPPDFIFQLTEIEWLQLQQEKNYQPTILLPGNRSQNVTASQKHRNKSALPYAFTEQGVAMLSSVLHSPIAIKMNIAIMRVFVETRQLKVGGTNLQQQLKMIREKWDEHDTQLQHIYDAIENILDENAAQRKWDTRQRIGFRKNG